MKGSAPRLKLASVTRRAVAVPASGEQVLFSDSEAGIVAARKSDGQIIQLIDWPSGRANCQIYGDRTQTGWEQNHNNGIATRSGSSSNGTDSTSQATIFTTGGTSGNSAGIVTLTNTVRRDWNPEAWLWLSTRPTITSIRIWAGLCSATPVAVSNPTAIHVAAFNFDTGNGDTTWRCVTSDGAGNVQNQDSGITVAVSTSYKFFIVIAGGSAYFYIDGVLVATNGTTLPGGSTALGLYCTATTLTNAARVVMLRHMMGTAWG